MQGGKERLATPPSLTPRRSVDRHVTAGTPGARSARRAAGPCAVGAVARVAYTAVACAAPAASCRRPGMLTCENVSQCLV